MPAFSALPSSSGSEAKIKGSHPESSAVPILGNPFLLAVLVIICGGILNFIMGSVLTLLELDIPFLGDLGFVIAALVFGSLYAKTVGSVMSPAFRLKIVGLFFLLYGSMAFLLALFIDAEMQEESMSIDPLLAFSHAIAGSFVESIFVFLFLTFGGMLRGTPKAAT